MSVIQKIRTKYAKLAGGVIAVALVAFILMDALSSRVNNLFGNDTSVVTVNGEEVDYIEYNRRIQNYETLYSANQQVDDNMRAQIRGQVVNELVLEKIIAEECEKLGIQTTEAEKKDLIYGQNPDQAVRTYQPFINPETKSFDPQYVKLFEQQVDQLDPSGKAKAHWEAMKYYITNGNNTKKYNSLITHGIYMPKFMVEKKIKDQNEMASIKYVSIPFASLSEDIKLTDEDLNNYIKENKDRYSTKEDTRSIEYVAFKVLPSSEDTARALGALQNIKQDFVKTEDAESFVNRNSDESYRPSFVMKKGYRSYYTDSIFNLSVGGVFGPYFENGAYNLVKVTDKKTYPDSVRCRHILVKTGERGQQILPDSIAKSRIDSIVGAIKSGASFAALVTSHSDDQGSKNTGGEYNFSFDQKAQLSTAFGDFIFDGKKGQTKVVKVENSSYSGYHYIEILNQKNFQKAIELATVTKQLYPGDETENNIYASASEFAGSNSTGEKFDEAIQNGQQRLVADNIKVTDFVIQGLGPARELIRWAYTSEPNSVSQVFDINGSYVVAKLSAVNKKGLKKLNDELRLGVEAPVKMKKQGELLVKKYGSVSSLDAIASSANVELQKADSFRNGSSFVGPIGYEPKVAGYSFNNSVEKGKVSEPIVGQSAVYYISVVDQYNLKPTIDSTRIIRERGMDESQIRNTASSMLVEVLKEKASVKYNAENL